MEMNDWEKAQKLSDATNKKWARCTDCDKWKKTTNIRIIDNMNLCKRCFKKRIEEFSEEKPKSFTVDSKDLFDENKNPGLKLGVKEVLENPKIPKKEI